MAKKITPLAPPAGSWKQTYVDGRLDELKLKEKEIIASIIALEASGEHHQTANNRLITSRAREFMNGSAPDQAPMPPSLGELLTDKEAIALAIYELQGVRNRRAHAPAPGDARGDRGRLD